MVEKMEQGNGSYSSIQNTLYSLFDENEINVAEILVQLPDLIAESESRRRFSFNWGARRMRSAINLSPSPPPPPILSIPPPTPPVVNGTCGGEDGESRLIRKPEITSPATPLSFPPSESDDKHKPKRSSTKISKRRRKKEDWLEMIAELTKHKELLKGEVETARLKYNRLKALNLELKAKRTELSRGETVEAPCMEINKSLNLKMEFAESKGKSAMKIEDMEYQQTCSTLVCQQPLIMNQTVRKTDEACDQVVQHPCSQLTHQWLGSSSSNRDVGPLGIPDLNVSIEDASGMDTVQQFEIGSASTNTPDFNKAMAAEARKNRKQIYKVKKANKSRYGHR